MGGQARARDPDAEVDHRLTAAELTDRQVAHAAGEEGEVLRLGRHHAGELRRQRLGLPELAQVWREIAEAAATGDAVGAAGLLVQRMGPGFAAFVVGQQRARHPLGPPGLAMLGAVGDVDDAEQVAAAGAVVDRDQQLAQEEVLVRRGPERALQHVLAEQPPAG